MRVSLYALWCLITSIGRQRRVTSWWSKPCRILQRSDSMRAVTIRREDVARVGPRRSLLHAEASSAARRALTSLPDSDLLPISVSLSHFPRADKCDVTILQPSRAVGSATLSSLHATRVAACLRRWTIIPCHLPLPQGSNGRRALGALSATTPVVDAIRRSRQITPDHARSRQIVSTAPSPQRLHQLHRLRAERVRKALRVRRIVRSRMALKLAKHTCGEAGAPW